MMLITTRFYLSPIIRQLARSKSRWLTLSISIAMESLDSHEFIWAQNCLSREKQMEAASLQGVWDTLIVLELTPSGTIRQKYSSAGRVKLPIFPRFCSPTQAKPWTIWLSSVNLKQSWRIQPRRCSLPWESLIRMCSWLLVLSKSSSLFQRRLIFKGKI